MDQIINWFILIIIFVFDPLAVALVIAFNNAVMVDRGIVKKDKVIRKRELYDEIDEYSALNEMYPEDDDSDTSPELSEEEELTELQKTLLMDVEDEEFDKADLDKDGVVTEEEKREYYETTGWKNSVGGNPYYTHPWFDWNKKQRWINDRDAINYWLNVKGGNSTALSEFKSKYPDNFDSKTY